MPGLNISKELQYEKIISSAAFRADFEYHVYF